MDGLFKYIRSHHVKRILQGHFRIGTLYEYRKIEAHGGAVGDADEGRHRTVLDSKQSTTFSLQDGSPEAQFFQRHILREDQRGKDVKIVMEAGAKMLADTNSPDMYLFCASPAFDATAMKAFGYDTCIRIDAPERFFRLLSHAIRHRGRFLGFGAVTYQSRETDHLKPHTIHPALMKGPEYAYQGEVRALWEPSNANPEPFLVHCRKAGKLCTHIGP